MLVAACNRQPKAIDEAKKRQAEGQLDAALTELQTVRIAAPGSADDAEAARLATSWLIDAAKRASAADDRRRRLEAALEWSPANGEAAARLCAALVDQEDDAAAEKCLGEKLAGKTGVPDDVVRDTRAKLDKRKEEAAARERATLLGSGRPAQLKSLIERWPSSPEAAEARQKLARSESLCADAASFSDDLRAMVTRLEKLSEEAAAARKAAIGPRLDAYERLGKDAASLVGLLKNKGIDAEAHAASPAEERLKKTLHDGFWALADLAGDLGDGLAKPPAESDESYDEHATKLLVTWERSVKKTDEKLRKDLEAAAGACPAHAAP